MKKYLLFTFILIIIFLLSLIVYWLYRNTSLLRLSISKQQIVNNNSETVSTDNTDYANLVAKEVIIPSKFKNGNFASPMTLNLPEDFEISLFYAGLKGPRAFDFDSSNNLYVADITAQKVYVIVDNDLDGIGDESHEIDSGLRSVHGIDYFQGDLYVGYETQILVYRDIKPDGTYAARNVLIDNLPGGGHSTRTVKVGPDNKIYVAIGSSCNVCEEADERRAAIIRYSIDGQFEKIYANGLRNTVGFIFKDGDIWGVDNGRDRIGDDIPVEEVNIIKEDKHYGWPYCHGDRIPNPEFSNKIDFCKNSTESPRYEMQAHSAPLGLSFVPDASDFQEINFPLALKNNLFVTFHGSWNRTTPTGYKVVRIDPSGDGKTINFVTGWLRSDGNALGRPVNVGFDLDGIMYVSDDRSGAIYRISYVGN